MGKVSLEYLILMWKVLILNEDLICERRTRNWNEILVEYLQSLGLFIEIKFCMTYRFTFEPASNCNAFIYKLALGYKCAILYKLKTEILVFWNIFINTNELVFWVFSTCKMSNFRLQTTNKRRLEFSDFKGQCSIQVVTVKFNRSGDKVRSILKTKIKINSWNVLMKCNSGNNCYLSVLTAPLCYKVLLDFKN